MPMFREPMPYDAGQQMPIARLLAGLGKVYAASLADGESSHPLEGEIVIYTATPISNPSETMLGIVELAQLSGRNPAELDWGALYAEHGPILRVERAIGTDGVALSLSLSAEPDSNTASNASHALAERMVMEFSRKSNDVSDWFTPIAIIIAEPWCEAHREQYVNAPSAAPGDMLFHISTFDTAIAPALLSRDEDDVWQPFSLQRREHDETFALVFGEKVAIQFWTLYSIYHLHCIIGGSIEAMNDALKNIMPQLPETLEKANRLAGAFVKAMKIMEEAAEEVAGEEATPDPDDARNDAQKAEYSTPAQPDAPDPDAPEDDGNSYLDDFLSGLLNTGRKP